MLVDFSILPSGCKWLHRKWLQVAAPASGCKWLQVAASDITSDPHRLRHTLHLVAATCSHLQPHALLKKYDFVDFCSRLSVVEG